MKKLLISIPIILCISGCDSDNVYTLYRSSATLGGGIARIHVATFDASDGQRYNMENCETAMKLFSQQPSVTVKYWCEKGRYKK